jgi:hypothetical protein
MLVPSWWLASGVGVVDPVSLVVAALAAGGSAVVTAAVQDAYAGLRDALVRRLRGDRGAGAPAEQAEPAEQVERAERAVRALEARAGETGGAEPLRAAVVEAGVATDDQVLAAARRVLEAADPAGARVGKYVVDLRGAKGVQVGDNPSMTINF